MGRILGDIGLIFLSGVKFGKGFGFFWSFFAQIFLCHFTYMFFMVDSGQLFFLKFPLRNEHLYKLSNSLKMMVLLVLFNCFTISQCCGMVL